MYIYVAYKLIAEHKRLPTDMKNTKWTEESHFPYPLYTSETIESTISKVKDIGIHTEIVINRLYANVKVKEQSLIDVKLVLDIVEVYGKEVLEEVCSQAFRDFHLISHYTLVSYIKRCAKSKK